MCKPQDNLEKVRFLYDLIVIIMTITTMITRVGFDDKEMKTTANKERKENGTMIIIKKR